MFKIKQLMDYFKKKDFTPYKHKDKTPITNIEFLEKRAKTAVTSGVGNCDELAATVFLLIQELTYTGPLTSHDQTRIESLFINGHCFVVVGRQTSSKLTAPLTWGPHAILVDVWGNTCDYVYKLIKNNCKMMAYIIQHSKEMQCDATGKVGLGHSYRWRSKSKLKNRTNDIFFWTKRDNKQLSENILFDHKFLNN